MWATEGVKQNPIVDVVLADTGPMEASAARDVQVVVTTSGQAILNIEVRDGANAQTVRNQYIAIAPFTTFTLKLESVDMSEDAQRVRVVVALAPVAGRVQASLLTS